MTPKQQIEALDLVVPAIQRGEETAAYAHRVADTVRAQIVAVAFAEVADEKTAEPVGVLGDRSQQEPLPKKKNR